MSNSWLYILLMMIASSFISVMFGSVWIAIGLDLLVLVAAYFILRNDPWVNMRASMLFLTILTVINVMATLNLISNIVNHEALIALIIWSWFGSRSKIFRYFVIGAVIYNCVQIVQVYRAYGVLDINTAVVSGIALLLVSYIDQN